MTYNQLLPTGVIAAWKDGSPDGGTTLLQGQGIKIGMVDTGAQSTNPALAGRIAWYQNYAGTDTSTQDAVGHGTLVAQVIGGTPVAQGSGGNPFRGGVAPQSSLYMARAIPDSGAGSEATFAQALNDMMSLGVRLFNISAGSSSSITEDSSSAIWEAQNYNGVLQHDALVVWAAGNAGKADVSSAAGLPYVEPQYAHNWLAVVNVSLDANGKVTGLDKSSDVPSNACGVAASWCLAAPGTFYGVPVPGTQFATGASDGTSNSAPIVTGIAALVWQKFPWMSAADVQETILGTATPLGDKALYGYGLVNADKAVGGPALLDWGTFSVNIPNGVTSTFSNDMSGSGSLVLNGAGLLVLTGHDTYTGGTSVQTGMLQVNGELDSDVSVINGNMGGGVLQGNGGTVKGNVTAGNNGNVSTFAGPLTIQGNYNALQYSTTDIKIGTPLTVTGTTSLTQVNLEAMVPAGYISTSKETLLTSAGGLIGTFLSPTVFGSVYTSGTVSYTPTEADITLSTVSVSSVAISSAPLSAHSLQRTAVNIDKALAQTDQWVSTGAQGHTDFIAAAADFQHAPTLSIAAASIESLSGEIHASSEALTLEQGQIVNRTIADRLADGTGDGGVWVQATGSSGDIGRSGYATGKFDGGGGVLGIDRNFGNQFTLGVAANWNRLNATYSGQTGTSNSETTGLSLYARYDLGKAYFSGRVGQDWVSSHVNRYALLGMNRQTVGTDRDDSLTSAYLETGFRLGGDRAAFTPFAAVSYGGLNRGSFAEVGAGGFGLTAGSQSYNQVNGQLGGRLSTAWTWSGGASQLSAYALWQGVLSGLDTRMRAAFVGASSVTFDVSGVQTPRNAAWFGVGLTTQASHDWSWFVNADGQASGGPTKSFNLTAGVRKAW